MTTVLQDEKMNLNDAPSPAGSDAGEHRSDTTPNPLTEEQDLDAKIIALKKQIDSMEQTTLRLTVDSRAGAAGGSGTQSSMDGQEEFWKEKVDADRRSVYVGQVDYSTTPGELASIMQVIGPVIRVTIVCDKWTGYSKGFAYVEYETPALATKALKLNQAPFRGRLLRVTPKRTNVPWFIAQKWGGYESLPNWLSTAPTKTPGRLAGSSTSFSLLRARGQVNAYSAFSPYSSSRSWGKGYKGGGWY